MADEPNSTSASTPVLDWAGFDGGAAKDLIEAEHAAEAAAGTANTTEDAGKTGEGEAAGEKKPDAAPEGEAGKKVEEPKPDDIEQRIIKANQHVTQRQATTDRSVGELKAQMGELVELVKGLAAKGGGTEKQQQAATDQAQEVLDSIDDVLAELKPLRDGDTDDDVMVSLTQVKKLAKSIHERSSRGLTATKAELASLAKKFDEFKQEAGATKQTAESLKQSQDAQAHNAKVRKEFAEKEPDLASQFDAMVAENEKRLAAYAAEAPDATENELKRQFAREWLRIVAEFKAKAAPEVAEGSPAPSKTSPPSTEGTRTTGGAGGGSAAAATSNKTGMAFLDEIIHST